MRVDLPRSLQANPTLRSWIDLSEPGRVTIGTGKVELGQGILTALTQIAADELGIDARRIDVPPTRTDRSPREGFTAGSMSVTESGAAVRHACRELRAATTALAAAQAHADPLTITITDGTCRGPDGSPLGDYWTLAPALETLASSDADSGPAPAGVPRSPAVGRVDLPDKLFGVPRFIHDLVLPGMVHARVVRPPSLGARLVPVDTEPVRQLAGVLAVVVDGSFVAVVAGREDQAVRAAEVLTGAATWKQETTLPDLSTPAWLMDEPTDDTAVLQDDEAPVHGAEDHHARYSRPFLAHASIAPSCALAVWSADELHVWSHSQGVFELRDALAAALHLPEHAVVVEHVEGAGCYGHNPADDVAADAALLAMAVPGSPVRVQWSRTDELAWDPFGPAMVAEVRASVRNGSVTDWSYDVWSNGHATRPGYGGPDGGLLGLSQRAEGEPLPPALDPSVLRGHGTARNAEPAYDLGRRRVTSHRLRTMPVRTSALRSLGAFMNVFAIESSMDELAAAADIDPLDFRLAHLGDERARAVLTAAAEAGDWHAPRAESFGRGIAYARYKNQGAYCAVVADVEATHELRVRRLVVAVDVGAVVNEDGVRNQIEGGAIQATSWTMLEQVTFDDRRVTSTDWESYPILRFRDVPRVDVHVLDRPELPSLGAGEAVQAPVPAAVANALHDALGVRVRDLPLSTDHILAAIDQ